LSDGAGGRFFSYVQRFNVLAVAVIALFALAGAVYIAVHITRDVTRNRRAANVVNAENPANAQQDFMMENIEKLAGTNYLMIGLAAGRRRNFRPISRAAQSIIYSSTPEPARASGYCRRPTSGS
jgi:hypothetical protein